MIAYSKKNDHEEWESSMKSDPGASRILAWMRTQRKQYSKSTIKLDRLNKLNSVGFKWTPTPPPTPPPPPHSDVSNAEWDQKFAMYCDFVETYGIYCVPRENSILNNWVDTQRRMNTSGSIHKDHRETLDKIGFMWTAPSSPSKMVTWDRHFAMYCDFVEKNDIYCLPERNSKENAKLIIWIHLQRWKRRLGRLQKDRMDKLNEIGFLWTPSRSDTFASAWDRNFAMYRDFVENDGICCLPNKKANMNKWIYVQRRKKRLGKLQKDRIDRLNEIGFRWSAQRASSPSEGIDTFATAWDRNFAMYRDFVEENGIYCAPERNSTMGTWISKQRKMNSLGELKKDQMEKLNNIGFLWSGGSASMPPQQSDSYTDVWDRHFAMYRAFVEKNGVGFAPEKNSKMSNWVSGQRKLMKIGRLQKDRMDKLNEIGFLWSGESAPVSQKQSDAYRVVWDRHFAMYRAFVEKNGVGFAPKKSSKMNNWVRGQRKLMKIGRLQKDRMDKLNEIGFPWSAPRPQKQSDAHTVVWDRHFAMYRAFVEKNGVGFAPEKNSKMSNWVSGQRKLMKIGRLQKDRMDKLNEIGFLWSAMQRSDPTDLLTYDRSRDTALEITRESSLDRQSNAKHDEPLEENNIFGHCSIVASPHGRVLTLDMPLADAEVSNEGCDDRNDSQLGYNSHTVDEQSVFIDGNAILTPERDERLDAPHVLVRSESEGEREESVVPVSPHGLETPRIRVRSESEFEQVESSVSIALHGLEAPHIMVRRESECETVQGTPHGSGLSFEANTLEDKSRRVGRRKRGCQIGQMQFDNFAPDSVGYKVMSTLLAKLATKGD